MFKSENDKGVNVRIGIAETGTVKTNSNATVNTLTIVTDATVGTLTISAKARLAIDFEPMKRSDGVTPLVIDLSLTDRTFKTSFPIKEWQAVPAGLDGSFYELRASGAGEK